MTSDDAPRLADLVFVGLNGRVIALDRYDGHIVWQWKAPKLGGYVSLLLDADRLLVGCQGYVYCLDPLFGQDVWRNPLKGLGTGITSLASQAGTVPGGAVAAVTAAQTAAATGTPGVAT